MEREVTIKLDERFYSPRTLDNPKVTAGLQASYVEDAIVIAAVFTRGTTEPLESGARRFLSELFGLQHEPGSVLHVLLGHANDFERHVLSYEKPAYQFEKYLTGGASRVSSVEVALLGGQPLTTRILDTGFNLQVQIRDIRTPGVPGLGVFVITHPEAQVGVNMLGDLALSTRALHHATDSLLGSIGRDAKKEYVAKRILSQ